MRFIVLCGLLAAASTACMASPIVYSLQESFVDGSRFSGMFTYDASTQSLSQMSGTLYEIGGTVWNLTHDANVDFNISPALQADGFGGVQDNVSNIDYGPVVVYLDIVAASPTTMKILSYPHKSDLYVDNDSVQSSYTFSYSITPLSAAPEPANFALVGLALVGLAGIAQRRLRRPTGV